MRCRELCAPRPKPTADEIRDWTLKLEVKELSELWRQGRLQSGQLGRLPNIAKLQPYPKVSLSIVTRTFACTLHSILRSDASSPLAESVPRL